LPASKTATQYVPDATLFAPVWAEGPAGVKTVTFVDGVQVPF
jgi:hypothetical protein